VSEGYYDDVDAAGEAFDQGFEEGREQAIPKHALGERLADIEEELEDDYEDRAFDLGEEIYNDQVLTEAEQAVIEADEDVFDQGLDLVEQMIGRELTVPRLTGSTRCSTWRLRRTSTSRTPARSLVSSTRTSATA
jgi:hypothetical protein